MWTETGFSERPVELKASTPREALNTYKALAKAGEWETLIRQYYGKKSEDPQTYKSLIGFLNRPAGSKRALEAFEAGLAHDLTPDESGKNIIIKFGNNGYLKLSLQDDGVWRFFM